MGLLLAGIGLAGLPDDLDTWKSWMPELVEFMAGNGGRWIATSLGIILFVASHQRIRNLLRGVFRRPVIDSRGDVTNAPHLSLRADVPASESSHLTLVNLSSYVAHGISFDFDPGTDWGLRVAEVDVIAGGQETRVTAFRVRALHDAGNCDPGRNLTCADTFGIDKPRGATAQSLVPGFITRMRPDSGMFLVLGAFGTPSPIG